MLNVRKPILLWAISGVFLAALSGCAGSPSKAPAQASPPPAEAPVPEEGSSAQTAALIARVTNENLPQDQRFSAAETLLTGWARWKLGALEEAFKNGSPNTRKIIAEAILKTGETSKRFIGPLMAMLSDPDPQMRGSAAATLAIYDSPEVVQELVKLANNTSEPSEVRLAAVQCLAMMRQKEAAGGLVELVSSPEPSVREAAAVALRRLTGLRELNADSELWRQWWQKHSALDHEQWLESRLKTLTAGRNQLSEENALLRERLARTIGEVYSNTPEQNRPALLMTLLKDPLPDARLTGATLVYRRLVANEPVNAEISAYSVEMLMDPDRRVRRTAAMVVATLGDPQSLTRLLARLKEEPDPAVREGLLTALGQLRNPDAIPVILVEISNEDDAVSATAAMALSRIAEEQPLITPTEELAVNVLIDRYERASKQRKNGVKLREALLTAMGKIGHRQCIPTIQAGLSDPDAAVRLAAVNALARKKDADSATLLVHRLEDSDRGVRQATVTALGTLEARKFLPEIFHRTGPAVEPDAAVREKAWSVAMKMLDGADESVLELVARNLATRPDAVNQRIGILQRRVEVLKGGSPAKRADAERQLGMALVVAERPAEAAPHLEAAWKTYRQLKLREEDRLWRDWISALLESDDPDAILAMEAQSNDALFQIAMEKLYERLDVLQAAMEYESVILLAETAMERLSGRLKEDRRIRLERTLEFAQKRQRRLDAEIIRSLLDQMVHGNEAQIKSAEQDLLEINRRAVPILLQELRYQLKLNQPDVKYETQLVNLLSQIAPELEGYSLEAPIQQKRVTVDRWMSADVAPSKPTATETKSTPTE